MLSEQNGKKQDGDIMKKIKERTQIKVKQEKALSKNKQRKNLFFVLKFFLIFIVLSTLIVYTDLSVLTSAIAFIEAKAIGLPYYENLLLTNGTVFEINNHCIGLLSIAIFASVVFALKKPVLKKKVKIFLIGAIALFPINIVRITLVLLIGKGYGAEAAELMHLISWFLMTGFIMLLWYYLTVKEIGKEKLKELI